MITSITLHYLPVVIGQKLSRRHKLFLTLGVVAVNFHLDSMKSNDSLTFIKNLKWSTDVNELTAISFFLLLCELT